MSFWKEDVGVVCYRLRNSLARKNRSEAIFIFFIFTLYYLNSFRYYYIIFLCVLCTYYALYYYVLHCFELLYHVKYAMIHTMVVFYFILHHIILRSIHIIHKYQLMTWIHILFSHPLSNCFLFTQKRIPSLSFLSFSFFFWYAWTPQRTLVLSSVWWAWKIAWALVSLKILSVMSAFIFFGNSPRCAVSSSITLPTYSSSFELHGTLVPTTFLCGWSAPQFIEISEVNNGSDGRSGMSTFPSIETVEESFCVSFAIWALSEKPSVVDAATNDLDAFPLNLSKNASEFLLSLFLSSRR